MEPCEVYDQVRCDECDKVFNSKNKLAQHVAKVHKFKDCVCDVCGKSFNKLNALQNHKRTHQTVQCESCDKTFKLSTFYMHRKTCQNVYKCTDCDYTTKIKKDLNKHQVVHTSKLQQCLFCSYSTEKTSNMKRHILNVHSDQKLSCNECDKQFSRESSLANHKESAHTPKVKCNLCDKEFVSQRTLDKHILHKHTANKIETRNGFMILHQTERTIKKKTHYCQQCDYNTIYKSNLRRHVEQKHTIRKAPTEVLIERDRTCSKCNYTFTRYANFRSHYLRCKVKLRKKVDNEDYVDLMKKRNFNFRDIAAVNRLHRSIFGRNAVRPNLIKNMRAAVDEMAEYHSVEKVTLQRNQKDGDKVVVETFETYASYVSDINNFTEMALNTFDVDPLDVKFLWSCDGGGGKTIITLDMFLPDGSHVSFIMLKSDGAPENYFNITTLLKKLNLPSFNFSSKFVGDGKLIAIILGLSAGNSVFCCPYCDGARFNADGVATNKGEFKMGYPRTLGWLYYNNSRVRIKKLRGEKVDAKAHRNCVREPIKIRDEIGLGDLECPIIAGHPPGPLHSCLIGSPNNLFKILEIQCPKKLKPFKKKYHLAMTEG